MEQLLEKIYESGNATVYKKIDGDNHAVTIKLLKTDFANPKQILKFNNEYSILADLDIPGIKKVISKGIYQGAPSIVSDYFDGITLRKYFTQTPFNLEDRLKISAQIAHILGLIHQKNIIHRDLTSDNILINAESLEINIVDFGQSIKIDVKTIHLSNPDQLEGTLSYFSPEQTGRMNRILDYRSDLYSVGVILYELFTGHLPFEIKDPLKLIHSHLALYPVQPHELNPELPMQVSRIIRVLLSKNAEDRYQSGFGLEADLKHCIQLLQETGKIAEFEISHNKVFTKFQIPQKLYGREPEAAHLLQAFEEVTDGKGKMILVSGYSGVGKTALVNEIHKPITAKRGNFIRGKFDQYNRSVPYSAFTQALNEYCQLILTEPDEQLHYLRKKISEALGHQGQIIVEIVPDLQLIIGKQQEVIRLEPIENKNRLDLLLLKFSRAIATIDRPLVLFLDDLQWADSASLDLIKMLASESESLVMLIIGAYRDNEVDATHPLYLLLQELTKKSITVFDLKVKPLPYEDVHSMIQDTLHQKGMEEISGLIFDKTKGNAFFTIQFIRLLLDQHLMVYSENEKVWTADVEKIKAQSFSDNVVDLMIRKIKSLEPATQFSLTMAAAIGNKFDLELLSALINSSPKEVLEQLWPALTEGYITPINENYRMFGIEELSIDPSNVIFSFAHDRVQQASYQLIPDEERPMLHLKIGRILYDKFRNDEDHLFDIVNHYLLGLSEVTEKNELERARQLNLRAGLRAKQANAIGSAIRHFSTSLQLTSPQAWDNDYENTLLLNKELAEAYYLDGQLEKSQTLIFHCLEKATNPIDRADIYYVWMLRLALESKYDEAVDAAIKGLKELEYDFPKVTTQEEVQTHLQQIIAYFQEHPIPTLYDLPLMTSERYKAVMKIMDNLTAPLYLGGKTELWILHVFKKILISTEHGMSHPLCYAFSELGLIFNLFEMFDFGLPAGDLARKLSYRFEKEAPRQKGRTGNIVANYVYTYYKHIRDIDEYNRETILSSQESGELIFGGYAVMNQYFNHYYTSEKLLQELSLEFESGITFGRKINHHMAHNALVALEMCVDYLMNPEMTNSEVRSKRFEIDEFLEICRSTNELYGPICLYLYSMQAYTIMGKLELALIADVNAAKFVAPIFAAVPHYSTYMFFHGILHLDLAIRDKTYIIPESVNTFMGYLGRLKVVNPANFEHKHLLLEAMKAQHAGKTIEALQLFEDTIQSAQKYKYVNNLAVAHEKTAALWVIEGRPHYALHHIKQSIIAYTQWGAFAKVKQLQQYYADIISQQPVIEKSEINVGVTESIDKEQLDLMSIFKASQAFTGLLSMDELKRHIIDVVMEGAGATRVALIAPDPSGTIVEIIGTLGEEYRSESFLIQNEVDILPLSIINYVTRKKEPLLINDVSADRVFNRDQYFETSKAQSIWVLPLIINTDLKGILYLENNLSINAFTEDRIRLLQLLSYQLGISIENARLYENMSATNKMYQKFVPLPFLNTLGYDSILSIRLGDQIQREMTIMFTDIRSYTTISELLSPEENFKFINEYLSYTAPCIEAHGGFINQFTGDGIMALFADADQALKAMISMQQAVRQYNIEREKSNQQPIKVGIGLHTGLIMLGVIGDVDRYDAGVISNEVTTASRIEGLTKMFDASILVSESTLSKIEDLSAYHYRYLGSVQVKGRTAAVKVYECFNGDRDNIIELKQQTLTDFNEGLRCYFERDFIIAAGHLKKVLTINPGDITAERYFRHAADLMVKGVGADWSGVEIMTEK
ncbi:MAG TPA: AAA family ATPase [Saprospiraceae bacterium]|nr:AAA family ATPase [Saprospiraceae bacterium]